MNRQVKRIVRFGELYEGSIVEMVADSTHLACYGLVYYLWPDAANNTVSFTVAMNMPGEGIRTEHFTECADNRVGVLVPEDQSREQR